MVASTLDTFLRVTSPRLFEAYGGAVYLQWVRVIKNVVVPKLDTSTAKLKIECKRLEEFLNCALAPTSNNIPIFKEL